MKQYWLGALVAAMVSGCGGGSPFTQDTTTDPDPTTPESVIPEAVRGDVSNFTYDPTAETLTVTGQSLDGTPVITTYRRRAALDRNGYQAYTAQASSLDRHTTSYVRDIEGVSGGVTVSGPQFGTYSGGTLYGRTAVFDRPDLANNGGLVSYGGAYIGMVNGPGDGGDLLAVAPGTDPAVLPTQAAEVTGAIFINADFADNLVNGVVYNRRIVDMNLAIENLELRPSTISGDGVFSGTVNQGNQARGDYGGLFGGTDAAAIAGGLYVKDHISNVQNEEEFGLFVLAKCGTAGADPICNQPVP